MAAGRIVVLLSGSGRSLENLLRAQEAGALDVEIPRVISSRPDVRGVDVALDAFIPCDVVARKDHDSVKGFSDAITAIIDMENPDLVVMAGFLSFYRLPDHLVGKVLNIHPSLLPLFGGKGFFGDHVHAAVLESGMRVTGCTVHFVNNEYDKGPIVVQRTVPVLPRDDVDTLGSRVFAEECVALPEAINLIVEGKARYDDGRVTFA